ncbi:E3 ubiquitin-protein ligase TRIM15-like isoform X3 [Pelodiscus sinensis]|uniref:E3 ubiquitin-protein ligase TRIM15-like isoform X3 n=1 Tax=Pelodiscus sinensis TaxID=13735 RepID=UPI003F6AD64D
MGRGVRGAPGGSEAACAPVGLSAHLKWTQAKRQMIVAEFQQLQQFLEEQTQQLLAQLEKLDEEIGRFQIDTVRNLSVQISRISERIGELEGTCQKPGSEFLQDVRGTLSRCETGQFQLPEEISLELEEQVRDFSQKTIALSETEGIQRHAALCTGESKRKVPWSFQTGISSLRN